MRLPVACVALSLTFPNLARAQGYAPVDPCDSDPPGAGCRDDADGDREPGQREEAGRERRGAPRDRSGSDDDGGASRKSDLIRPATDPLFFVGAIGPTFFGINGGRRLGRQGDVSTRGKLSLDLGYHLDGTFEGPAIGASIEQTFSGDFYVFNPAFKFWWDIQPIEEYAIYIAPFAKAGYALRAACPAPETCPEHAANIALGAEGRVVFEDRWIALIRPFQLDTYLGNFFDEVFWLNYSVLIGGGLTF